MNTRRYLEGDRIDVAYIKESQTKRACILNSGSEERYMDKYYISLLIEIDGKRKNWRLNRKSLENMNRAYGEDTEKWVGTFVQFVVEATKNGVEMVVAYPIPTPGVVPGLS